jgi:hypothetical protein
MEMFVISASYHGLRGVRTDLIEFRLCRTRQPAAAMMAQKPSAAVTVMTLAATAISVRDGGAAAKRTMLAPLAECTRSRGGALRKSERPSEGRLFRKILRSSGRHTMALSAFRDKSVIEHPESRLPRAEALAAMLTPNSPAPAFPQALHTLREGLEVLQASERS